MIHAKSFIEAARDLGFNRYTGVPCSFLTPFINYVINDNKLNYISSANEGDAVATASGAVIGGERSIVMMQNSGLGNAISPLTSLNYVFGIPVLLIITHRGAPGLKDEPQHELMGRITDHMLDSMHIPWEYFPDEDDAIYPALQRATGFMQTEHRPYCFIMSKGTVSPHALQGGVVKTQYQRQCIQQQFFNNNDIRPNRFEVLEKIIAHTPVEDFLLIATTGYTGRELFAMQDRQNQLYMVGSMGCATSFALGLALARPEKKIIVLDGDGAALMRMGNFSTIGGYAPKNLVHILLDNEAHDSTGAQSTVSASVDFAEIARACGYAMAHAGNKLELIDALFSAGESTGPRFGHLKINPGTTDKLPRPDIHPRAVLQRLMQHIGTRF